jgi:hypothetical protein
VRGYICKRVDGYLGCVEGEGKGFGEGERGERREFLMIWNARFDYPGRSNDSKDSAEGAGSIISITIH